MPTPVTVAVFISYMCQDVLTDFLTTLGLKMTSIDFPEKISAIVFGYHNVGVRCLSVLISAGIDVRLVVTHEDDAKENIWFDSISSLARQHSIRVICPENPNKQEVIRELQESSPDIIFSFYYRKILKPEILALPRLGSYNMHGSLLPKYRGRAPVNWAIIHGETDTGTTLHQMVAKADAGAIVDRMAVPILCNDTSRNVFDKVVVAAEIVMVRALPGLLSGRAKLQEMNIQDGSYFSGRTEEDGRINVWQSARQIHDLVRAVSRPYPGAFVDLKQGRLKIWKTIVSDTTSEGLPALFLVDGQMTLRAGDGACLRVLESDLNGTAMKDLQASLGTHHIMLDRSNTNPFE